jgi:hypothetical protein
MRRWGGLMGHMQGHKDGGSTIQLIMWGITHSALGKFGRQNSNLYQIFVAETAETLYHEIGHHVYCQSSDYKEFKEQFRVLGAAEKRAKTPEEQRRIGLELCRIEDQFEAFAENYAKKIMQHARKLNLLPKIKPRDVRYFKIQRDRFIYGWLGVFQEAKKGNAMGGWSKILGIFDHLRKMRLGKRAEYSLYETFISVFGVRPKKDELRRFRKIAVQAKPLMYVSPAKRHYPYFSEAKVKRIKALVKRQNFTIRRRSHSETVKEQTAELPQNNRGEYHEKNLRNIRRRKARFRQPHDESLRVQIQGNKGQLRVRKQAGRPEDPKAGHKDHLETAARQTRTHTRTPPRTSRRRRGLRTALSRQLPR